MNTVFSSLILVLVLLKVSVKTNLVLHDSSNEIFSNALEGYSTNNVPDLQVDISSASGINHLQNDDNDNNAQTLLKFEPAYLDFQQRPLGIPILQKVTLFNTDKNRSIDMKSISGNTVHFHSSFFEDKHVPPLGNTSFNVVFLGRDEGTVESDLLIHTTTGDYKYKVKGASVSSSYRLRPIVGIKLPQNVSFSPLIFMYNPHIEPIQVTEVYSTGDNFHLELPTGASEGPKNMWEIPPLQTKAIIRVRFHSTAQQNHTAFIRFKMNNTESILAVPLQVEVTSSASLYTPQGFLDFGFGGTLDAQKTLNLYLGNPTKKEVKIDGITSFSKSVRVEYKTLKVGSERYGIGTKIATVTLDWKSAFENKEFTGKILVTYNNGQAELEIPYYVNVVEGNLLYDSSVMTYFINDFSKPVKSRDLLVKNNYSVPFAITNISLPIEAEKYFYMSDFKMVVLNPQEEAIIFTLYLKGDTPLHTLKLNSVIVLTTNISIIEIPLLSYNGKLHVEFPYRSKDGLMDLGLIGIDVRKEIYFVINNFNTAVININKITTSLPLTDVQIIHCNKGNYTDVLARNLTYTLNTCDKLELDEYAIILLAVQSSYMEGQIWGTIVIETQYENLTVPVHYKIAHGRLAINPEVIVFDNCFPEKICTQPLRIHSTFNEPMIIEKIVSIPPDPRLSSETSGHIMARSSKILGHIYLTPSVTCLDECYLGINFIDSVAWFHTMMLSSITSELDLRLLTELYNRYLNQTENGIKQSENLTLKLDTSEVKWHIFQASIHMTWPSLVLNDTVLNFPLTQVGSISYFDISLSNPSDHNLVIQLVLSSKYPEFTKLNEGLPSHFLADYNGPDLLLSSSAFFFNEKLYLYRVLFKTLTGVDAHEATLPILLLPGTNFTFSLGFDAEDPGFNSGFLYIRNNLTIMEVIQLSGRSVIPNFKFGNRKLDSDIPLFFELNEKQLKECEQKRHAVLNFSMKRSFTARNLGDLAITIRGFYINGLHCEGYGFKVLNCDSFVLLPNTSRKIDIGFMPDFALTKIICNLTIDTSLIQDVSYTLVATVPGIYLSTCSGAINRPEWEPYLYYVSLGFMSILLVFVVGMIITDSEHLLKGTIDAINRANATVHPPLDLRQVGAQTRFDIHSSHVPKEKPLQTLPLHVEFENINTTAASSTNFETDKYSVLIPTTGKSKKKLNEGENEDEQEKRRKSWIEAHKLKNKSNTKDIKRSVCLNSKETKKETRKQDVKKYEPEEEETFSVSTDSSNNEETEILKIIGSKSRMSLKNRNKLSKKYSTEEQFDDTHWKDIKKTFRKPLHKIKEKEKSESNEDEIKQKVVKLNHSKDYIDKRNLKRKLSLEKKQSDKSLPAQVSPIQSTMWGDNKATFSDIVAKNDTSPISFVQPLCSFEQQSVENYTTNADLGPIGSRKVEHVKEPRTYDSSNSFFSNGHLGLDSVSKNWEPFAQPASLTPKKEDPQQSTTIVSGIWDNITNQDKQSNLDLACTLTSSHESGNYLWGSSSVWKPWEPSEVHRSRTRTPPGFSNNINSDLHENEPVNQNYDLFGMSNIWAKQYPNPWNSNSKGHNA